GVNRARRLSEAPIRRANHAGEGCREDAVHSLRPDQGLAAWGLSANRCRRPGIEPESRELLRRSRAVGIRALERGGGYQLLARQNAAVPHLLLRRRAPVSARLTQLPGAARKKAPPSGAQL